MIKTVEAVLDEQGNVRLLDPVHPGVARRAFVTILDEEPAAEDWNRPEEDEAWSHLQKVQ